MGKKISINVLFCIYFLLMAGKVFAGDAANLLI